MIRISAVILSFNSAAFLERAVRSLADELLQSPGPDEIWVVDNGSRDASPQILRALEKEFPDLVKGIYLDRNQGTTKPRNLALRQAGGRFLLLIDSDIEVQPGTLATLLAACEATADRGIVAPELRYQGGRVQMSTDVFPTLGRKVARLFALRSMEENLVRKDRTELVDYAISAFWLFRREVMDKVGLLDENIFYSPEDVDYCIRVWQAGFSVCLEPSVFATHHAQELSRTLKLPGFSASHARGLFYLFRKHGFFLSRRSLYQRIGRFERRQTSG